MLNEEEIFEREELFYDIMNSYVLENFEIDEDCEPTEEDAYIASIVLEHFIENYKEPTLEESLLESITGYDFNKELYEELEMIMLDETVGTAIASVMHGIRKAYAQGKVTSVTKKSEVAKNKYKAFVVPGQPAKKKQLTVGDVAVKNAGEQVKAAAAQKAAAEPLEKGFKGGFERGKAIAAEKKAIKQTSKAAALKAKADKAKEIMKAAETKRKSVTMKAPHDIRKSEQKASELAAKIDTGIENVKNVAKSGANKVKNLATRAVSTGAERIGGFAGRIAGAFS